MATFGEIITDEIRVDLIRKDLESKEIDLSNPFLAELLRNIRTEIRLRGGDFPKEIDEGFDFEDPVPRGDVSLLREIVAREIGFINQSNADGRWGDQRQYDQEDGQDEPDDPFEEFS